MYTGSDIEGCDSRCTHVDVYLHLHGVGDSGHARDPLEVRKVVDRRNPYRAREELHVALGGARKINARSPGPAGYNLVLVGKTYTYDTRTGEERESRGYPGLLCVAKRN